MKAEILTSWVEITDYPVPPAIRRFPELIISYPGLKTSDITGQPAENIMPNPNLYSILVECDAPTLAAIEADPDYFVLWSENV